MINIIPIPAFKDNYIWTIINTQNLHCVVIDPGDPLPIINFIQQENLILDGILVTHHHNDHSGGVKKLIQLYSIPVYGPANEKIEGVGKLLKENDKIYFKNLGLSFSVIEIPGHTKGHIAFYSKNMLFCGDTLFSAGCGKLFEGTYEEMFLSLSKITTLPFETKIYCAHEYTLANLYFAETVEPNNSLIKEAIQHAKQLRIKNSPTLPTILHKELKINPFLRSHEDSVINSVKHHFKLEISEPVKVFQALRIWKDNFK